MALFQSQGDRTRRGCPRPRTLWLWLTLSLTLLILCISVAVSLTYVYAVGKEGCDDCGRYEPPVSASLLGVYNRWAVSTDAAPCAPITRRIFGKGGTLADAAVATMLCMGVVLPHSMGIGGGFLATIYQRSTGKVWSLIAREKAPAAASETTFVNNKMASVYGGLAIGVPGELRGYKAILDRMGTELRWEHLFEDAVRLARDGFPVGAHLANAMREKRDHIYENSNMRNIFWDAVSNDTLKEGNLLVQKDLADTLEAIAQNGVDHFYTGKFAEELAKEVQDHGGIISKNDLEDYKVEWADPIEVKFKDGRTLYSAPPPGSGAVLAYLMGIMDAYRKGPQDKLEDNVLTLHRFAEACKFAYAKRTLLGDPVFVDTELIDIKQLLKNATSPAFATESMRSISNDRAYDDPAHYGGARIFSEDHGTAHASFLGPNGDAISVTSTINYYFGSFVRTSKGVMLNNEMDDFSTPGFNNVYGIPPSKANFIRPGKRPMSSMAPAVFVNATGGVDLVLGGAGGAKITSGIALVSMRNLWQGNTIKEAIDFPRLHHQLVPNNLDVEQEFPEAYAKQLTAKGHHVNRPKGRFSIMMGISRHGSQIHANSDHRKGGTVDGE